MILYDEYKPKKITLRAISDSGKEIEVKAYITPDEKHIYVDYGQGEDNIKELESTHRKCTVCGEVYPIKELFYKKECRKCRTKEQHGNYLQLPEVDISFPMFIDDDFITDEDHLVDYITENGISDSNETHNAIIEKLNFDLIDHLDDLLSDRGYEENIGGLVNNKDYEELIQIEKRINEILGGVYPIYYPDTKTRLGLGSIKKVVENDTNV